MWPFNLFKKKNIVPAENDDVKNVKVIYVPEDQKARFIELYDKMIESDIKLKTPSYRFWSFVDFIVDEYMKKEDKNFNKDYYGKQVNFRQPQNPRILLSNKDLDTIKEFLKEENHRLG